MAEQILKHKLRNVTLLFRPYREGDNHHYIISVAREKDDEYGERLCEINSHDGKSFWISRTDPEDYGKNINSLRFPDKEQAAAFFYHLRERCRQIATNSPLPEDVMHYLTDRARGLRQEEQRLLGQFLNIRFERASLRKFGEKNQIEAIQWITDDTDEEAAVKKLLTFEVSHKRKRIPLFSETVLYERFGKEDARTILALLEKVCNFVAPHITSQIL